MMAPGLPQMIPAATHMAIQTLMGGGTLDLTWGRYVVWGMRTTVMGISRYGTMSGFTSGMVHGPATHHAEACTNTWGHASHSIDDSAQAATR
jgi:hypothetical protein